MANEYTPQQIVEIKANSKASIPWLTSSFDYSTGNFVNEKIFYKNTSRDVI